MNAFPAFPAHKPKLLLRMLSISPFHNHYETILLPANRHTHPPTMTMFLLADVLDLTPQGTQATISSDNARGHGKQKEQERQRKRSESRQQSQLFMCRKPRRTADAHGDGTMSEPTTTTATTMHKLYPSGKRSPLLPLSSPMSVRDFLHHDMMEAAFFPSLGGKNSPRQPVRKTSMEGFVPIRFCNNNNDESQEYRPEHQAAVCLADILSSMEL